VCDLIEPLFEDPKEEIFGELLTRVKPKRRPKKKVEAEIEGQQKISDMFKTLKK
jgi:DNA polymerase delta subunit 1